MLETVIKHRSDITEQEIVKARKSLRTHYPKVSRITTRLNARLGNLADDLAKDEMQKKIESGEVLRADATIYSEFPQMNELDFFKCLFSDIYSFEIEKDNMLTLKKSDRSIDESFLSEYEIKNKEGSGYKLSLKHGKYLVTVTNTLTGQKRQISIPDGAFPLYVLRHGVVFTLKTDLPYSESLYEESTYHPFDYYGEKKLFNFATKNAKSAIVLPFKIGNKIIDAKAIQEQLKKRGLKQLTELSNPFLYTSEEMENWCRKKQTKIAFNVKPIAEKDLHVCTKEEM